MRFNKRIEIGVEFSKYIALNNVVLPIEINKRRLIFIKWYMVRYSSKSFELLFKELTQEILYISESRLNTLLFNEE